MILNIIDFSELFKCVINYKEIMQYWCNIYSLQISHPFQMIYQQMYNYPYKVLFEQRHCYEF